MIIAQAALRRALAWEPAAAAGWRWAGAAGSSLATEPPSLPSSSGYLGHALGAVRTAATTSSDASAGPSAASAGGETRQMGSSSRQPSDIGSSASPSTSSESAATASVPPPAGDALARWREQVRWQQPLPEDAAPLPRRYSHYVHNILYRELLLKGSPNKWADVPQLSAITVRLLAREQKFSGGREAVERWEMLLHRVALEYMAGTSTTFTPAADLGGEYAQEPREGGRVAGVEATLTGPLMWAFLEKLVVLVLPAQIGFEGIPPPQVVPNPPPFAPRASNRRPPIIYQPRPTAWRTAFRVGNVLAFPDLEENFDLWQGLGALQVELAVEGTTQPQLAELLLHGLALPTLEGDAAALALSGGANLTADGRVRVNKRVMRKAKKEAKAAAAAAAAGED